MCFLVFSSRAQFTRATLQATGLTCALCSNAINKALLEVPFIASVRSDIKNSAFNMVFKEGFAVDIDAIKAAVEDAGFSVGSLKLTGQFDRLAVEKDKHVRIGKLNFHFTDIKKQVLDGEQTLTVVDRDFIPAKEFKKWSGVFKKQCVVSGQAAGCCTDAGIPAGERVYHITI